MAFIAHLFRAVKHRLPMEELPEATLTISLGVEGCAHARSSGRRQVLLIDAETLRATDLAPGVLRENITTDGLAVGSLKIGQRLRIRAAELEVTGVCTPCSQLEKIRPGLRREMWGRRGMLCRVLVGGLVRRGDTIEKLPWR